MFDEREVYRFWDVFKNNNKIAIIWKKFGKILKITKACIK